ncbi:MAG: hypothetical protein LIP06_09340 [Tannerellaceae bacterium]|nr:hypothetical protein [Tannerellaceae bacterium]
MKRISLFVLLLVFTFIPTFFANNNLWKVYLSYYTTHLVEESSTQVYVVATGSLFSYNKEDQSIRQYDKSNYLNDTEIVSIRYNTHTQSLLIIYENANIDILSDEGIINIPYLKQSTAVRNKNIYSVFIYKEYAYVTTGFGIMVVNMKKKEITETYNLSLVTTSCCIFKEYIYASTEQGVLFASLNENLLDKNNWNEYPFSTSTKNKEISKVFLFKDKLFFFVEETGIYYDAAFTPLLVEDNIENVKVTNDKLVVFHNSKNSDPYKYSIYSDINTKDIIVNSYKIQDISSFKEDIYWLAESENGLRSIAKNHSGSFEIKTEAIGINGPRFNSPYRIAFGKTKFYVIPGGKNAQDIRFENPATIMIYDYKEWSHIHRETVSSVFGTNPRDYTSIVVDPTDEDHIYISSFGDGLVEIKNSEAINLFRGNNSTLEDIGTNNTGYYIDGLAFDKDENLWMTNSEVTNGVKILNKDGTWSSVYVEELSEKYTLNDILITSGGYKWINIPRPSDQTGIAIIDKTDHTTSFFFSSMTDQDGKFLSPSAFTCMAEDKNNNVWIGTSNGPAYFSQPDRVIHDETSCYRIKLTDENTNELYYFLDNQRVTCIAVDPGNRKWFGTDNNGVYVLSEDNEEVIYQFNTTNSPLLSDMIYTIAINEETGEVFIGTDKGLVSYQAEAIAGKEDYSNVYAFPNPVRPEFDDRVTITGLMDHTNVKITDLNGNLIYQTKSVGGQASWNCRNKSGQRVATGIYLVFGKSENGPESVVTKIAIIK